MTNTTMNNMRLQDFHNVMIEKLDSPEFSDGTYILDTFEKVEFKKGYQVTFCMVGFDYDFIYKGYYEFLCDRFLEASMDNTIYLGKFGGTPEISFRVADKALARKLAKRYNQISIWDWHKSKEIKTGGTGVYNG